MENTKSSTVILSSTISVPSLDDLESATGPVRASFFKTKTWEKLKMLAQNNQNIQEAKHIFKTEHSLDIFLFCGNV